MLKEKIRLIALLAGMTGSSLYASTTLTNFATGDVLICFRHAGGNDLVIDAGPISNFRNYAPNSTNSLPDFTAQSGRVGLNGSFWQVCTWTADKTLYITKPRVATMNAQTTAWTDETLGQQQAIAGYMSSVVQGAVYALNSAYDASSTATAVVEPDDSSTFPVGSGQSYHDAFVGGYTGSYWQTQFQGNPENKLSGTFTSGTVVARSDFYQLTPTNGVVSATYLGYFELAPSGAMTYVAYPTEAPSLKSFVRVGNQNTISFSTGTYGAYTLLGSSDLATWTTVTTLQSGDTKSHSTNFTDNASAQFYKIQAQ
jgi:hypothetical protein